MSVMVDDRLTEIGRIVKAHGLDGTVRLVPLMDEAEYLFRENTLLYLKSRRGVLMPVRIESVRPEAGGRSLFFVKFDRISDRSEADAYRDTAVYTDEELPDTPDDLADEVTEPIGYRVVDPEGPKGEVVGVMDNPAHPILEVHLERAGNEDPVDSLLIPWVDEYVISSDASTRTLTCRNLNQLIHI